MLYLVLMYLMVNAMPQSSVQQRVPYIKRIWLRSQCCGTGVSRSAVRFHCTTRKRCRKVRSMHTNTFYEKMCMTVTRMKLKTVTRASFNYCRTVLAMFRNVFLVIDSIFVLHFYTVQSVHWNFSLWENSFLSKSLIKFYFQICHLQHQIHIIMAIIQIRWSKNWTASNQIERGIKVTSLLNRWWAFRLIKVPDRKAMSSFPSCTATKMISRDSVIWRCQHFGWNM